jgi:hypothetical protein
MMPILALIRCVESVYALLTSQSDDEAMHTVFVCDTPTMNTGHTFALPRSEAAVLPHTFSQS